MSNTTTKSRAYTDLIDHLYPFASALEHGKKIVFDSPITCINHSHAPIKGLEWFDVIGDGDYDVMASVDCGTRNSGVLWLTHYTDNTLIKIRLTLRAGCFTLIKED